MSVDTSLLITIGLIFLITLIGAYVRSTIKDPCLRSFVDFNVTLERTNGKVIWGVMQLESTGMELKYQSAVQDEQHIESSYILYAAEYGDIQAIYRYADMLSERGRKRRTQDIARSFHPGPLRLFARQLRNFLVTATDSLGEVFNVLLGRVQKAGRQIISDKGDAALSKLGTQVLGQVGSTFDPLLERYIGQRVVVELLEDNEVHEHVGIFKNYSPGFIEVLDVQYPQHRALRVTADGRLDLDRVVVSCHEGMLTVNNGAEQPLLVYSLDIGGEEQLLNAVVDSGETVTLYPGKKFDIADLHVRVVRELDMIVPRTRAVVRHRAEFYEPEELKNIVFDIVFDVGVAFAPSHAQEAREKRLRDDLERNPSDAAAAANLGALLLQRQAYAEAEKWLRRALGMQESLPDGGRRVRMEFRELERRTHEASTATTHSAPLPPTA